MSDDRDFIVCVPWGRQAVASVRRSCCECGAALALDGQNAAEVSARELEPICAACALPRIEAGEEIGPSLVEGAIRPAPARDALLRYLRKQPRENVS